MLVTLFIQADETRQAMQFVVEVPSLPTKGDIIELFHERHPILEDPSLKELFERDNPGMSYVGGTFSQEAEVQRVRWAFDLTENEVTDELLADNENADAPLERVTVECAWVSF